MSVAYKLIESFVKVRPLLCGKPTEDGIAAKRCFRVIIFILVTFRLGLIFFNDRMTKREENNDFISSFRGDDRFVVVPANIVTLAQETQNVSHCFILIDAKLNHLLNGF